VLGKHGKALKVGRPWRVGRNWFHKLIFLTGH
jgi:hypothetical protein